MAKAVASGGPVAGAEAAATLETGRAASEVAAGAVATRAAEVADHLAEHLPCGVAPEGVRTPVVGRRVERVATRPVQEGGAARRPALVLARLVDRLEVLSVETTPRPIVGAGVLHEAGATGALVPPDGEAMAAGQPTAAPEGVLVPSTVPAAIPRRVARQRTVRVSGRAQVGAARPLALQEHRKPGEEAQAPALGETATTGRRAVGELLPATTAVTARQVRQAATERAGRATTQARQAITRLLADRAQVVAAAVAEASAAARRVLAHRSLLAAFRPTPPALRSSVAHLPSIANALEGPWWGARGEWRPAQR